MSEKYIILGAGIAGLSAAKAIRENDPHGEIDIFTAEKNLPYSRPMLTKAPFRSFDPNQWILYGEEYFQGNNIRLHLNTKIQEIDIDKKTVKATSSPDGSSPDGSSPEVYPYHRLIIATGAESLVPPISGADSENAFTIRRSEDILKIKRAFTANTKAVVIGGGVIGLEVACGLSRYGSKVTVLEALPYLMPRQIDKEASDFICQKLSDIEIHTNVKIKAIHGPISKSPTSKASSVILEDGRAFPCDFVVMACGVKASTDILPDSIKVERAIVIDEFCRTSCDDIFACGDCAQLDGINYALWSEAMAQGLAAGKNASLETGSEHREGQMEAIKAFDTSLVISCPELSLFALGDTGKNPDIDYQIRYAHEAEAKEAFLVNPLLGQSFQKEFWADGKLVGAIIIGSLSSMADLKEKILRKEITK